MYKAKSCRLSRKLARLYLNLRFVARRLVLGALGWPAWTPARNYFSPKSPDCFLFFIAPPITGFDGRGKMDPNTFLKPFCETLAINGNFQSLFYDDASFVKELACCDPHVIVPIYNEELHLPCSRLSARIVRSWLSRSSLSTSVIFNKPSISSLIGRKSALNTFYAAHGIPVPSTDQDVVKTFFSNANIGSNQDAFVVHNRHQLSRNRYNTEFIDTVIVFKDISYYSCLRIMAVGTCVVDVYVRLKPVSAGSPSVHTFDTPLDPLLIDYAYHRLVVPNFNRLSELTHKVGDILGPGFYAHDILIRQPDQSLFIAETNYKFIDDSFIEHISPLCGIGLKSYPSLSADSFSRKSALHFLKYCESLAAFHCL